MNNEKCNIDRIEYYLKKSSESSYTKYDTNNIENLEQGKYDIYAIAYDRAENKKQIEKITAEVIDPLVAMYGKNVNYTVTVNDTTLDNWKVFYIDKETKDTFLIYGEYLPTICLPTTCGFAKYNSSYPYSAHWDNIPSMQSEWSENSNLFKNSFNLEGKYNFGAFRCVSTLLNTNNWISFVEQNYADLAIGSPTIEMFRESWINNGNESFNIQLDNRGYKIDNTNNYFLKQINGLYLAENNNEKSCRGYFLSSPLSEQTYGDCHVTLDEDGFLGFGTHVSKSRCSCPDLSIRPVVHLKNGENGVELQWNSETNKYDIIQKTN